MNNSNPQSTRDVVLTAIRESPGITREQLLAKTDLTTSKLDPARIRLWEAGLIEPDSEDGWDKALANRAKEVGWHVVDDAGQQAAVRARAQDRKRRNAKPTADEQALQIVEALEDPTVRDLVHEMTKEGAGSRRARDRAAKTLRQKERARKHEAKEADRANAANADFKRLLTRLWESRGVIGAIDKHLIEERARVAKGEPRRMSDQDWLVALNDVREIIKSLGEMWQNVRDLGGRNEPCPACGVVPAHEGRQVGTFVVEGEAVEISPDESIDTSETVVDATIVSPDTSTSQGMS